eukprot:173001_1
MAQQVTTEGTQPGSEEGSLNLNEWLKKWNISQYADKLRKQGMEFASDFKYIKSKEQFNQIISKLGDDIPMMHVLKLEDAWTTIVPETQQKPDSKVFVMIGPKEMEIRKKLHDRFKDVSQDIHVLQTAINKFNESVVQAKKAVNENTEQIIIEVNNKRERLLKEIDSMNEKNTEILNDKLHHLQRISKIAKYKKQQFDVKVAEASTDTDQLKELLTLDTEDDEKQNKNYNHFKDIGKECRIPGSVNIVFDEQSMKSTIDSVLSVQNDTITQPWNLKEYYYQFKPVARLKFDTSWSTEYYT